MRPVLSIRSVNVVPNVVPPQVRSSTIKQLRTPAFRWPLERNTAQVLDALPERLPLWNLVVARDDGKTGPSECVARAAAGQRLEMLVLKEVKQRSDASVDFSRPGLTASF
jgi:hypothetical protein